VVVTKNHLVTRDIDILSSLARVGAAQVTLSITTLDPSLARVMEPRTSSPQRRLDAIAELSDAGIPAGVLVAPVVPGLTEHELPAIIDAAARAGAVAAGYIMLRLPHGVKDLFAGWLREHYPEREKKALNRIREIRGGKLYDSDFATRGRGRGEFADQIAAMFDMAVRRAGINRTPPPVSAEAFRRPTRGQFSLFDD
jgi:DNA repair photolyase